MVIGIDIGGTKMRAVSWTGHKVARSAETKTPKRQKEFAKEVQKIVGAVADKKQVTKIGIGVAGVIRGNVLILSPNIPAIKHFNFSRLWPPSVLIRVDNDGRCFARGEHLSGIDKNGQSIFALTVGTGIGRAYGENGKIQKIKKFEYPEHWEPEYQKLRDSQNNKKLAEYLGGKLIKLIEPYKPQIIIVGGGVSARAGFFTELKKISGLQLKKSKFGKNAVAIGAAGLF